METYKPKVAVFGDSLFKGVVYKEDAKKYEKINKSYIEKLIENENMVVYNFSRFGLSTSKAVNYIKKTLEKSADYQYAVIQLGGNDCNFKWVDVEREPYINHNPLVKLEDYEKNIIKIVEEIKKCNIIPIIVTLPPISSKKYLKWISKSLDRDKILMWLKEENNIYKHHELYNLCLSRVANKLNVNLIDLRFKLLLTRDFEDYLCSDGIHINEDGHRFIEQSFRKGEIKSMNDFVIMTDSGIDLTQKMAEKMELKVIPLSFTIDGKVYFNYLDERDITTRRFYNLLREEKVSTTSQVNPNEFIEFMKPTLEEGKDILYIGLSSALSGTYHSSVQAKEELLEMFPDRKIVLVDSKCASMGEGLLVTYAYELKKAGKSVEEVGNWVEENKSKFSHLFTVGDLNHLRRGGRLSYGKAMLGTLLKVKPLLHVNIDGKLVQTGKTRGRQSSLRMLVDRLVETITNPKDQLIYISHGDCYDEAEEVKNMILEKIPVKEVVINFIGPVIGSHSGLGTLAIFYMGEDRFKPYQ